MPRWSMPRASWSRRCRARGRDGIVRDHPPAEQGWELMTLTRPWRAEDGFTLLEALIALALMGLIMGALASVTAQWLPSWNRGIIRAQRNEQGAVALDRLTAD